MVKTFLNRGLMKGNKKVIVALNAALRDELLAINQYFLHAEMLENWKYTRLAKYIKKQSIDEMRHAEGLIERILFLDGTPNLTEPMKLDVGLHVKEQLERQLQLELDAVVSYNKSAELCRAEGDNASKNLFEKMLHDEEGHVDWLEAQLHQVKELGYERYLSEQIDKEES
jgi:bacterioferritin